jgi:hypothetical protein
MERIEAENLLYEIVLACERMGLESFKVVQSKANESYGSGYAVAITAFLDLVHKGEVFAIAKKHNLSVQEEKEALIIYKPRARITFIGQIPHAS